MGKHPTTKHSEIYSNTGDRLYVQESDVSTVSRKITLTRENTESDLRLFKKNKNTLEEEQLILSELADKQRQLQSTVLERALGLANASISLDEFQKESMIKKFRASFAPPPEDFHLIEEKLKQEFRRRRTLHHKVDPGEKKYSISPAWQKLIVSRREKSKERREKLLKKVFSTKDLRYPNGSTYHGQWSPMGMQGKGNYKLFYDVSYEGTIDNGSFHGFGTFTYPNGAKMTQLFIDGMMRDTGEYIYRDKLQAGRYCETPDRRFFIEKKFATSSIKPAGRSYFTNARISRKIPNGCYDAGDGFYNPLTRCVHDPKNPEKILRIPTKSEHEWIMENCRKAWDEVVGYRADLVPHEWKRKRSTLMKTKSQASIYFDNNYLETEIVSVEQTPSYQSPEETLYTEFYEDSTSFPNVIINEEENSDFNENSENNLPSEEIS